MFKKISLMLLILCLILAGCAVTGTKSTIPAEKQVSTGSARIQAGQQENDGTDNDNVNKAGSEDPTQSKKDQSPSSLSDQKETVEQDAVINEGSSDSKKGKGGQVELLITRDFGQQVILHELVTLDSGWTIMDLLQAKCDVKTRYGGGFIDSINQLKSSTGGLKGEMQDWFYYVNGICPDVGGLDYSLGAGEMVWWDYHPWQAGSSNSAVIGSYPEPFLSGYQGVVRPTTIVCPAEIMESGQRLAESLKTQGVSEVKVVELKEAFLNKRNGPTLVLGEWESLEGIEYLKELNQSYQRNGMSFHFQDQQIQLLNFQGKVVESLEGSAGVIGATASVLGDPCPLWLVSGSDRSGFEQALELMIKDPGDLTGKYNLAISGEKIKALPLK